MNGNELFEKKYETMINNIILKNEKYNFLRGYVNSLISRKSLTTIYGYLGNIIKFLNCVNKDPSDLRYDDYINYLASINKKTSSYQIMVYSSLKKLSSYLAISEVNLKDPMKNIERPKSLEGISTKKKRENGYLTQDEITEYLNNVKNCYGRGRAAADRENWVERDLAIIILFLTTGMRCSALCKLNVENIDFNKKKLITVDKEQRVEEHYLDENVVSILYEWSLKRKQFLEENNVDDNDAFFISKRRCRLTTKGISDIVKKYAVTIKNKNITPHKLRATYGTQLYNATHDLYLVQKCMGHSSPKTSELYIRGTENNTRIKAAEIMSNMIFD